MAGVPMKVVSAGYQQGMSLYDQRDYARALRALEGAAQQLGECEEDDAELCGSILLGLGSCHQQLRNTAQALQYFDAAVTALQQQDGVDGESIEIISPLINMGLVHFQQGDHSRAMSKYKRAQRIVERLYCTDRMVCADLYHNIGVVHDSQDDFTQALQNYSKSLRIRERFEATREQQLLLALTRENVAMLWRDQDNHEEAIRVMNSVLPVRKKLNGPDSTEYGNSLFNLGLLHFDVGRLNSALAYFSKCYSLREGLLGAESSQTVLCGKYVSAIEKKISQESLNRPGGYTNIPETYSAPQAGAVAEWESPARYQQQDYQQQHQQHQRAAALLSSRDSRASRGESPADGRRRSLSLSHLARSPSPQSRGHFRH
eukprot:TRINITY_DN20230_c0_g1_i1.p1 TRINITY_DN20230_c0_g1~~TRINITY_DN20230_c0_g1_i1.p1  ORF type:complete len:373 (+),score=120.98 TRINITY_DN20230_c0_g1_i1:212-1330(+)